MSDLKSMIKEIQNMQQIAETIKNQIIYKNKKQKAYQKFLNTILDQITTIKKQLSKNP